MANQKIMNEKKSLVNEIKDNISNSTSNVVFSYQGLTDSKLKELRIKLREALGDFKIYKNTLLNIALKDLNYNIDTLTGPNAIAFGKDQISVVKILSDFSKTNKELNLVIGIVDNEVADINTLNKLATIPSREALLTMLASSLLAIPRDLAIGLNMLTEQKEN